MEIVNEKSFFGECVGSKGVGWGEGEEGVGEGWGCPIPISKSYCPTAQFP